MGVYMCKGGRWRYDFCFRRRRFTKKGYPTAEAAQAAEAARRAGLFAAQPEVITASLRARAIIERDLELSQRLATFVESARDLDVDSERAGFAYVVNAETGLTKIGKARRPLKRFWEIRTHSPAELWLLAAIPTNDAAALERWFHHELHRYRVRGEWFRLPGKTLQWLCGISGVVMSREGRFIERGKWVRGERQHAR